MASRAEYFEFFPLDKKCIECNIGYYNPLYGIVREDLQHDYCRKCKKCGLGNACIKSGIHEYPYECGPLITADPDCLKCGKTLIEIDGYYRDVEDSGYHRSCLTCKECNSIGDHPINGIMLSIGYHRFCLKCKYCDLAVETSQTAKSWFKDIYGPKLFKDGHRVGVMVIMPSPIIDYHQQCCDDYLKSIKCKLCNLHGTPLNPIKGELHLECYICKICGAKCYNSSGYHTNCYLEWVV